MKDKNNNDLPVSRKWILTLLILVIASLMCFVPPIVAVCFFHTTLVVLSGELWVSTMLIITSGYHISNVFEKKIQNNADLLMSKIPGAEKDDDTK